MLFYLQNTYSIEWRFSDLISTNPKGGRKARLSMTDHYKPRLVKAKEYAEIHHYHVRSVRKAVYAGRLEYYIIDGEKYLDANEKPKHKRDRSPYGCISYTRAYHIYQGMKRRCYDEKCKSYKFYGARGIRVCDEWLNNPIDFAEWAYNNGYADDLEIDRIDSDGNYEPSNCRWVTSEVNLQNRKFRNMHGRKLSAKEKAEAEMKELRKQFGFKNEEWFEEMRGYIWRNYGLQE